ncbi:uncharacterized protein LOC124392599 isoform X2 [Silurus meridionalis]|uniref:uncharacterized protein LOC124392599 isoform X2 n=1 Tax=Silurus meridionalis TaxID=175797 RepID=UPI001EEB8378|nr:uncharacterized protein LOC124392599 isoform X2 [Silurus meridionalis]
MANLLDMFILQLLSAFFTPCLLHITSSDFISVHPGENITLLCNITDYPEILWYQLRSDEVKLLISAEQGLLEKTFSLSYNVNKSHFDPTESSSSVSLVIIGVRETDLGFYYCGGRNDDKHIQFGKLIRLNFNITGKSVSSCSSSTDAPEKEESMHYASIQHGDRPRAAAKKNTATDPDCVTYAAVASQQPRRR